MREDVPSPGQGEERPRLSAFERVNGAGLGAEEEPPAVRGRGADLGGARRAVDGLEPEIDRLRPPFAGQDEARRPDRGFLEDAGPAAVRRKFERVFPRFEPRRQTARDGFRPRSSDLDAVELEIAFLRHKQDTCPRGGVDLQVEFASPAKIEAWPRPSRLGPKRWSRSASLREQRAIGRYAGLLQGSPGRAR